MSYIYKTLGCCVIAALAVGCDGTDSSKSAEPSAPAAAPDAKKVDAGTAGNITGKVVLEGTPPANAKFSMASDPACGGGEGHSESFVVDNGALQNVFVYIKDGLGNKYIFDTPTEPVKLDQKGCHYIPHVVGVRTTQPLEISNSDATLHNVHGMPKDNAEFNQGQPVQGFKNAVTFNKE